MLKHSAIVTYKKHNITQHNTTLLNCIHNQSVWTKFLPWQQSALRSLWPQGKKTLTDSNPTTSASLCMHMLDTNPSTLHLEQWQKDCFLRTGSNPQALSLVYTLSFLSAGPATVRFQFCNDHVADWVAPTAMKPSISLTHLRQAQLSDASRGLALGLALDHELAVRKKLLSRKVRLNPSWPRGCQYKQTCRLKAHAKSKTFCRRVSSHQNRIWTQVLGCVTVLALQALPHENHTSHPASKDEHELQRRQMWEFSPAQQTCSNTQSQRRLESNYCFGKRNPNAIECGILHALGRRSRSMPGLTSATSSGAGCTQQLLKGRCRHSENGLGCLGGWRSSTRKGTLVRFRTSIEADSRRV